jgi:hypothetical protein
MINLEMKRVKPITYVISALLIFDRAYDIWQLSQVVTSLQSKGLDTSAITNSIRNDWGSIFFLVVICVLISRL